MYQLNGLQRPNESGGLSFSGAMRLPPGRRVLKRRILKPGFARLDTMNAAAHNKFLRPMQLNGLGRMTAEQEAQKKQLKQFFKAQRKAINASIKGKKARKAAYAAAGVLMKDKRQTMKAFKQSVKLGVPTGPTSPNSPVQPGPGNGGVVPIIEPWYPPASTGSGGGGGGGAPAIDPATGEPMAEGGGGILPLAALAAGIYFLM